MNPLIKFIGSGFYTGYIKYASGTFGSLAALLIYLIPGFERNEILIPATIFITAIGVPISTKFEQQYGKDPSECTVDEVSGMWISLLFLPKQPAVYITAFFIWRALDIIKPSPAREAERLPGGTGIMLDDVISGIYTLGIMHALVHFRVFSFFF